MSFTKIIIQGFKSLKNRTEVPIAPLTLMFGPNSAGKTAVVQALEAFAARLDPELESNKKVMPAILAMVNPNPNSRAHRLANSIDSDEYSVMPVTLGIEFDEFPADESRVEQRDDFAMWACLEIFWRMTGQALCFETVQSDFGTQFATKLYVHGRKLIDIASGGSIVVDPGVDFLTDLNSEYWDYTGLASDDIPAEWGVFRINIDHPVLAASDLGGVIQSLTDFAGAAKSSFIRSAIYLSDTESRVLILRAPKSNFRLREWSSVRDFPFDMEEKGRAGKPGEQTSVDSVLAEIRLIMPDVDNFCSAINLLLDNVSFISRRELVINRVAGTRSALNQEDLTVEVESNDTFTGQNSVQRYAAWLGMKAAEVNYSTRSISLKREDDLVNDAMAGGLFPGRGYRVKAEVTEMDVLELVARHTELNSWKKLNISLYLNDANGRTLDFDEVGSGIRYVMPVLAALWDAKKSWIEQPELHLHPAAQCALGDVFLRAFNRGHFSIVETHSEHLLLRILRRIRQTHRGKVPDPELRCSPEAVAVLYFEPQEDGGTKVYPLRISRGGDFMDRWPSGFFEEREQELFGE